MGNNQEENCKYKCNVKDESDTNHAAAISMDSINNISKSVVKIETKTSIGTGFLMKSNIKGNLMFCLFTNFHIIDQKYVDSKKKIYIHYGQKDNKTKKSINLDNNKRLIKCFDKPIDTTVIQIIEDDNIPEDNYLIADDSYLNGGYETYIWKDFYLAGYPDPKKNKGDIYLCSGKVLGVNGFEFSHDLDTRSGSSGSPICLIDNKKVIGIHKMGDKGIYINFGTFIGHVLELLENENFYNNNVHNEIINNDINNINNNFCFFTLKEYEEKFVKRHKSIALHYANQSEYNYNKSFKGLISYLHLYNFRLKKNKNDFLKNLEDFKDIYAKDNCQKIVFKSDFINDINDILLSNDFELIKRLYYFIAGFMLALNNCGKYFGCKYKISSELYHRRKMGYHELIKLKNNINQIISFKIFLSENAVSELSHIDGEIYKAIINVKTFFSNTYLNLLDLNDLFDCKIYINYVCQKNWETNCFSVSKGMMAFPEKIFNLFSFFKVKEVKIDENNKSAEVFLDSIGKKEILENGIWNKHKEIHYNSNENLFELIDSRN